MGKTKEAVEYLERLSETKIELGLERVRRVAEGMGLLGNKLPVVLVGGTNGKGSTAFTLSSLLSAHGLKAGLYTSPHLRRLTERVSVDGKEVDLCELSEAVLEVRRCTEELEVHLTYFEVLTLSAMRIFLLREVDVAVLEVGLGGRLDATNIFQPLLSVITGVSLEHQDYLGHTLREIAFEKAHILRSSAPACIGPLLNPNIHLDETLMKWALSAARELEGAAARVAPGAKIVKFHSALREEGDVLRLPEGVLGGEGVEVIFERLGGGRWRFKREGEWYSSPYLGGALSGSAALAVGALDVLAGQLSFGLKPDKVKEGLEGLRWDGRGDLRVYKGRRILLDGAHNMEGARNLSLLLRELGGRFNLIFGCLKDKPCARMLNVLKKDVGEIFLVQTPSPRAAHPFKILDDFLSLTEGDLSVTSLGSAGVKEALERTEGDALIAGSLYLVGEGLKLIEEGAVSH